MDKIKANDQILRSSHLRCSKQKGFLKTFTKFKKRNSSTGAFLRILQNS